MTTQDWSDNIFMVELLDDPELTDELNSLIEQVDKDPKDVVLNFAQIKFLNSSNISRLLKLRKSLLDLDKRLLLCSIPSQVCGVFLLTGLDTLFDVAEDPATALATLQLT